MIYKITIVFHHGIIVSQAISCQILFLISPFRTNIKACVS